MFSETDRDWIRTLLLDRARADKRIFGAAITGSMSHGAEDQWSDIDLFFGVARESNVEDVLADWTGFVYRELGALHHFDLQAGSAIYRAFLLSKGLEVDLAFTPSDEFGARGRHFRVVFGRPVELPEATPLDRDHLIGLAWHHVLHGRISIERNKLWQAEYWISAIRDHALALACLRFGETAFYAKGVDSLPHDVTAQFEDTLVRALTPAELQRALQAVTALLVGEIGEAQPELARRLAAPLLDLARISA